MAGAHIGGPCRRGLAWPQLVELRAEEDRFLRLLEILGLWYEKGKLLIFVGSQEKCDDLFRELLRVRVPADQHDH